MSFDVGVFGAQVALPDGMSRVDLGLRDGRFAGFLDVRREDCAEVIEAKGLVALPGLIDAHNHPYYDDDIVEFATSAAHGGITTMLSFAGTHMGRKSAPQSAIAVTADFIERAGRLVPIDYGVHSIVGPDDDPEETVARLAELGVTSVKLFLAFPGARMLDDATVLRFMQEIARQGMLCMIHCENGPATQLLEKQRRAIGAVRPLDYAATRPAVLEAEAVFRALSLAEVAACPCYIVHVTCLDSLEVIERFRLRGNTVFVETCPHYLLLTEEDLSRKGGLAKISPPVRTFADVEALWAAVADGTVDVIASDCSGQRSAPKQVDDIFEAPYGIPGVEQMVALMWDEFVNRRGIGPEILAHVMGSSPADIFGIPQKGRIAVGADADLVLLDPISRWTVRADDQHGNSDYSLYEGRVLQGRPTRTFLRGRTLLAGGVLSEDADAGRYLARGRDFQ